MNIGIDIDNTITDIEKELFKAANEYTKKINNDFDYVNIKKYDGFTDIADFYSKIFGWDKKQIDDFFRNDRIEVVDNAKPRESVVSVIKKLKEEGHNIYIITARTNKYDDIPYERTRNWLDKNKIVYDKLIIGAVDKAKVCKNLGINIFIDDQINNCIDLEKNGFIVIRLTDSNDIYENIINVTNFKDVYNYINKLGE